MFGAKGDPFPPVDQALSRAASSRFIGAAPMVRDGALEESGFDPCVPPATTYLSAARCRNSRFMALIWARYAATCDRRSAPRV
jgi:hypothetical protein